MHLDETIQVADVHEKWTVAWPQLHKGKLTFENQLP